MNTPTLSGTPPRQTFEWPTIFALVGCYASWCLFVFAPWSIYPALWIIAVGIITTFYWSLVHEVIHGHPTQNQTINELMVAIPLGWLYPIGRFRDTHLEHHRTGELTDPFDDPESWYLTGPDWRKSSGISRLLLRFNNTLFGRMLIGPIIVATRFLISDLTQILRYGTKGRRIAKDWIIHLALCCLLAIFVFAYSEIPVWQFLAAAYLGISLLLIRTFLEHQAIEDHGERTVIIEALCPIAFLFLFNNLHCVHHMRPGVPWYQLPRLYRNNRDSFLRRNSGYVYRSYAEVIQRYFFRSKEPVAHPFLRS